MPAVMYQHNDAGDWRCMGRSASLGLFKPSEWQAWRIILAAVAPRHLAAAIASINNNKPKALGGKFHLMGVLAAAYLEGTLSGTFRQ